MPDPRNREALSDRSTRLAVHGFFGYECPNRCGNGVSSSDKHPTWHCWRCRVDAVEVEYAVLRVDDYDRLRAENERLTSEHKARGEAIVRLEIETEEIDRLRAALAEIADGYERHSPGWWIKKAKAALARGTDEAQAPPITAAPSWLAPKLPGGGKPARPSRDSDLTKEADHG